MSANLKNVKVAWRTINEISGQAKCSQSFCLDVNNEFNKYFLSVVDEVLDQQAIPDYFNSLFFKNLFNF